MAKQKLLIELDYDFLLFGICCAEKPYRLCWALNQSFAAKFVKGENKNLIERNRTTASFPVFYYRNEELFTDYKIIVNKQQNKLLVPEYKQADFLFMVNSGLALTDKNTILQKIKTIPFIQTAFEIIPQHLKSKDNLHF